VKEIGDIVAAGDILGYIGDNEILAPISGVLRGLIRDNYSVTTGLKIGDIDPRIHEQKNCFTISDKLELLGEELWKLFYI
jgi:xanthine dehydrogenase accessory factor